MLDLERPVRGRVVLWTVPGAVDYLVADLLVRQGVSLDKRRHDAVLVTVDGPLSLLAGLRYFMSAGVLLGESDDVASAVDAVRRDVQDGPLSAVSGPVRFRVADVGPDRWPLRDALVADGWVNEPGDWDVNLDRDGYGLVAQLGDLYWTKRFGSLLRAPASTNPVIAAVMARLAKPAAGDTVLDPFCGAGTLLVAAADAVPGPDGGTARLWGSDHADRWVRATRTNLADRHREALLWRGDAREVPLPDGSVDRVVSNLPFGKRVGSHIGNQRLYPAVLAEIARLLPRKGRAVLLTEDKRLFTQTVQRTRGIRVIKDIGFTTGGAHPSAYVVTTRRTR